jgi:hypothetical protein
MDTSDNKPKTIATIDVNIQWPTIPKRDWIDEAVQDHLNCVLCGTELTFKHHTNFADHTVAEDASCQGCRIRSRQTVHTLQ